MVTDRYQHVRHHDDGRATSSRGRDAATLPVIAIDNVDGVALDRSTTGRRCRERCVLLFGQEGPGLSAEALAAASATVADRRSTGPRRSINAGAAAAVVMYEVVPPLAVTG